MSVNFNTHLSENLPEALTQTQRALLYGDTLFETLRVFDGQIPLLDRHWARLSAGLSALGFDVPEAWGVLFFRKKYQKFARPMPASASAYGGRPAVFICRKTMRRNS